MMSNEAIIQMLDDMDNESRALRHEALRISWSMRGGVSYDDAMYLSQSDREIVDKILKENLEITKESKMPYF